MSNVYHLQSKMEQRPFPSLGLVRHPRHVEVTMTTSLAKPSIDRIEIFTVNAPVCPFGIEVDTMEYNPICPKGSVIIVDESGPIIEGMRFMVSVHQQYVPARLINQAGASLDFRVLGTKNAFSVHKNDIGFLNRIIAFWM